jgi:hypothetical protein
MQVVVGRALVMCCFVSTCSFARDRTLGGRLLAYFKKKIDNERKFDNNKGAGANERGWVG